MEKKVEKAQLLSQFLSQCGFGFYKAKKLMNDGEVKIDGKRTKGDIMLTAGSQVVIFAQPDRQEKAEQKTFSMVFCDQEILVVSKESGVEVLGDGQLEQQVQKKYPSAHAVNRLDRNTMGLVCFSLTDTAHAELLQCFKDRRVKKTYEAIVFGVVPAIGQKLKGFLFKDAKKSLVYVTDQKRLHSVPIETHYELIKQYENFAHVKINLVTGRTHQIRAHMAHIGHFVIGDGKYGQNKVNKGLNQKTQCLFCTCYEFDFPNGSHLSYLNGKKIAVLPKFSLFEQTKSI